MKQMSIIEKVYKWNGTLNKRKSTNYIVIHHAAASKLSVDDIHRIHINNGWAGIGYHFYVRKDGKIYRGRPIDTVGAQTSNYNSQSIGICFEGNFEKETMTDAQLKAGREIVAYARKYYPNAKIVKHRDLNATACPGRNFPFDKILQAEDTKSIDILKDKIGLSEETIKYMKGYEYGDELIEKIAKAVMSKPSAVSVLKTKIGLENKTIEYLKKYEYGDELIEKIAKML